MNNEKNDLKDNKKKKIITASATAGTVTGVALATLLGSSDNNENLLSSINAPDIIEIPSKNENILSVSNQNNVDIYLSFDEIEENVVKLNNISKLLIEIYERIKTEYVENLSNSWYGKDAEKYINELNNSNEKFNKIIQTIELLLKTYEQVLKKYDELLVSQNG